MVARFCLMKVSGVLETVCLYVCAQAYTVFVHVRD